MRKHIAIAAIAAVLTFLLASCSEGEYRINKQKVSTVDGCDITVMSSTCPEEYDWCREPNPFPRNATMVECSGATVNAEVTTHTEWRHHTVQDTTYFKR